MSVILPAVLPVFITALIGYALAKANRPFDNKTITFLVASIGTPALVFFNLSKTTPFEPLIRDEIYHTRPEPYRVVLRGYCSVSLLAAHHTNKCSTHKWLREKPRPMPVP